MRKTVKQLEKELAEIQQKLTEARAVQDNPHGWAAGQPVTVFLGRGAVRGEIKWVDYGWLQLESPLDQERYGLCGRELHGDGYGHGRIEHLDEDKHRDVLSLRRTIHRLQQLGHLVADASDEVLIAQRQTIQELYEALGGT